MTDLISDVLKLKHKVAVTITFTILTFILPGQLWIYFFNPFGLIKAELIEKLIFSSAIVFPTWIMIFLLMSVLNSSFKKGEDGNHTLPKSEFENLAFSTSILTCLFHYLVIYIQFKYPYTDIMAYILDKPITRAAPSYLLLRISTIGKSLGDFVVILITYWFCYYLWSYLKKRYNKRSSKTDRS